MHFDLDGKRVFAATGGKPFEAGRPTVVFLHGSGLDHSFWGLYTRFFAFRRYAVLAPDFPGHTHSEGPPLASIEAMADWLHDVLAVLGAGELSLVGHSQGCLVALEYASRYPERLRSVSFIASGLATPVNAALLEAAREDPDAAVGMMLGWGYGAAGQLHRGPIPGNSMLAGGYKVMRGNAPAALAADLGACNDYAGGRQAANGIRAPAQVIIAGKDRMAPARASAELVEHLAGAEVAVVAQAGHMLPQEAPDRCRRLLRDFIFEHNPAG